MEASGGTSDAGGSTPHAAANEAPPPAPSADDAPPAAADELPPPPADDGGVGEHARALLTAAGEPDRWGGSASRGAGGGDDETVPSYPFPPSLIHSIAHAHAGQPEGLCADLLAVAEECRAVKEEHMRVTDTVAKQREDVSFLQGLVEQLKAESVRRQQIQQDQINTLHARLVAASQRIAELQRAGSGSANAASGGPGGNTQTNGGYSGGIHNTPPSHRESNGSSGPHSAPGTGSPADAALAALGYRAPATGSSSAGQAPRRGRPVETPESVRSHGSGSAGGSAAFSRGGSFSDGAGDGYGEGHDGGGSGSGSDGAGTLPRRASRKLERKKTARELAAARDAAIAAARMRAINKDRDRDRDYLRLGSRDDPFFRGERGGKSFPNSEAEVRPVHRASSAVDMGLSGLIDTYVDGASPTREKRALASGVHGDKPLYDAVEAGLKGTVKEFENVHGVTEAGAIRRTLGLRTSSTAGSSPSRQSVVVVDPPAEATDGRSAQFEGPDLYAERDRANDGGKDTRPTWQRLNERGKLRGSDAAKLQDTRKRRIKRQSVSEMAVNAAGKVTTRGSPSAQAAAIEEATTFRQRRMSQRSGSGGSPTSAAMGPSPTAASRRAVPARAPPPPPEPARPGSKWAAAMANEAPGGSTGPVLPSHARDEVYPTRGGAAADFGSGNADNDADNDDDDAATASFPPSRLEFPSSSHSGGFAGAPTPLAPGLDADAVARAEALAAAATAAAAAGLY